MAGQPRANPDIRAFIGVCLPPAVHRYLQPFVDSLAASGDSNRVRWVAPANRHITLVFLGPTQPAQIPALLDLISRLGRTTAPFEVEFDHIRQFPDAKSAVVAAMLRPAPALLDLFEQLQAGCEKLGFNREKRRFQPHVTLGRLKGKGYLLRDAVPLALTLTIDDIKLLQSTTTASGSRYTPLGNAGLGHYTLG